MRKPCCNDNKNKGAWSKQEDQKLIDYIRAHGEGCWRSLPQAAGLLRCGKSCRLRWINYLRPDVKRGNFGEDEEDLIIKLHALLGNRWSLIAGRLPGRTDNEVKNYWNSHLRRKLMRMGIDPNNHRLAHSLPRDHQDQRLSSESSDNNNITYHKLHVKPSTQGGSNINKNDRLQVVVSDDQAACGSSLEEDHQACALRQDLNLELSMAIKPSASSVLTHHVQEKKHNVQEYSYITRELGSCSPPTLLLFT